jgi:hypothetical protein
MRRPLCLEQICVFESKEHTASIANLSFREFASVNCQQLLVQFLLNHVLSAWRAIGAHWWDILTKALKKQLFWKNCCCAVIAREFLIDWGDCLPKQRRGLGCFAWNFKGSKWFVEVRNDAHRVRRFISAELDRILFDAHLCLTQSYSGVPVQLGTQ